jgi:hypothetical protein
MKTKSSKWAAFIKQLETLSRKAFKSLVKALEKLVRGRKPILAVGLPIKFSGNVDTVRANLVKNVGEAYYILIYNHHGDDLKLSVLNERTLENGVSLPQVLFMLERNIATPPPPANPVAEKHKSQLRKV